MKFVAYFNRRNTPCAVSNMACGTGYADPIDVYDAVEDSNTAQELLNNLKRLKLLAWYNLTIDRETDTYVRIKGVDTLGNVHYLKATK